MSEKEKEARLSFNEDERAARESGADVREMLAAWNEDALARPSTQLDGRVLQSYRSLFESRRANELAPSEQTAGESVNLSPHDAQRTGVAAGEALSQLSEVKKMKTCPTCQESFADKFAFCPVDGARLQAVSAAVEPEASSIQPSVAKESARGVNGVAPQTRFAAQETANGTSAANGDEEHAADEPQISVAPPSRETRPIGRAAGTAAFAATAANGAATNGATAANGAANGAAAANGTAADGAGVDAATNGSTALVRQNRGEYHLTMIEDTGLSARLAAELREVAHASQLTWPELKRDPLGFTKRMFVGYGRAFVRFLQTENVKPAIGTAVVAIAILIAGVFGLGILQKKHIEKLAQQEEEVKIIDFRDIPKEEPKPTPEKGIGDVKNAQGRVGFQKNKGEGSLPQFKKASGGGGGGEQDPLPAQRGVPPPPSPIPAPIPKNPPMTMPKMPAGIDIDPLLAKNMPGPKYGDFNSKSDAPSNGPGTGRGMGNGSGMGIGTGEGNGVGPGRGGNIGGGDKGLGGGGAGGGKGGNDVDYNKIFSAKDVTRKAQILSKPEAGFTEEARKNGTTGVVRVRLVLGANGSVSNIQALNHLPDGLTEKAIAAARQIKFVPAQKDGHNVSQWITFEYVFTLY